MNNIPINEAETIFEPYWDSGESYPCKRKYSVFANYKTRVHPSAIAKTEKTWCNVTMQVEQGVGMEEPSCTISRDCHLILDGYDLLQCNASFPKKSRLVLDAVIDGEERRVIDCNGFDENREIKGDISGHELTRLSISLYCEKDGSVNLFWLGLANKAKQQEMEQRTSGFSSEWEGCFEETPRSLNPRIGMFATAQELERLREKVKRPPFDKLYREYKEKAEGYMTVVPEELIGDCIPYVDIRLGRDRDRCEIDICVVMMTLSFVGAMEQDEAMLRLAARTALSVACCKNWCEGIMGVFPGATWHHRSFLEDSLLQGCAQVLDFAGHILSWHGRNIIHNAMILKGLARMECDFHVMEYIHHMNQGIVFCKGRIAALIALSYDYPRFRRRIDEAEKVLEDALENYILEDGGSVEGPGYWQYSISESLETYYLLAKYRGKQYEDYLPDSIIRTEQFALATLSTAGDGIRMLAINDTHPNAKYHNLVSLVFSRVGKHQEQWRAYHEKSMKNPEPFSPYFLFLDRDDEQKTEEPLIDEQKTEEPLIKERFWNLTDIGHVGLIRETEDCGMIHAHLISGPNLFSHCHSDNGSILLEAGTESFLIDLGTASYSSPFTAHMQKAVSHNLFVPLNPDGFSYNQRNVGGAKTVHSQWEDGVFTYTADLKNTWEKGFYRKNYRRVFSPEPHVYLVMDEVEYAAPHASSFLFITDKPAEEREGGVVLTGENACVTVTPLNWTAEIDVQFFGGNQRGEIHRVRMNTNTAPSHRVITAITVAPKGQTVPLNLTAKATEKGFSVTIGNRTYIAENNEWIVVK